MTQFRVESTEQSVTVGVTTPITFATEIFDTDNVISGGVFTVPAGWDGQYASFSIGIRLTSVASNLNGFVALQLSTNGGSVYATDQATNIRNTLSGLWIESGPRLMVTGHKYRVVQQTGNFNSTVQDSPRSFFTGRLLNQTWTEVDYFRANANSTIAVPSGGAVTTVLTNINTVQFDTTAGFSSSVYTVPASLNGGYGIFYAGIGHVADDQKRMAMYITRSTNGGSTYSAVAQNDPGFSTVGTMSSGVLALVTGDKYRVETYNGSLGFTVEANTQTFMGGEMWKA